MPSRPSSSVPPARTIHLVHHVGAITLPLVVHGWEVGRFRYLLRDGAPLQVIAIRERTGAYALRYGRLLRRTVAGADRLSRVAGRFPTAADAMTWLRQQAPNGAAWSTWLCHVVEQLEATFHEGLPAHQL